MPARTYIGRIALRRLGSRAAKTSAAARQIVPNIKKVGKMPMAPASAAGEQTPQRPHAEEGHRVEAHHASPLLFLDDRLQHGVAGRPSGPPWQSRSPARGRATAPSECESETPASPRPNAAVASGDHPAQADDALPRGQEEAGRQGPGAQRRGEHAERVGAAVRALAWPAGA